MHKINWDSIHPQPIHDRKTGRLIGRLMPRISQLTIQNTGGIHKTSAPEFETRDLNESPPPSYAWHDHPPRKVTGTASRCCSVVHGTYYR